MLTVGLCTLIPELKTPKVKASLVACSEKKQEDRWIVEMRTGEEADSTVILIPPLNSLISLLSPILNTICRVPSNCLSACPF